MKLSDIFKFKLFEGGDKANLKIVNENFEIAEKELVATNKEITDKVTEINDRITELNNLLGGKLDVTKIANNLVTTEEGYALDARMGKVLGDDVNSLLNYINNRPVGAVDLGYIPAGGSKVFKCTGLFFVFACPDDNTYIINAYTTNGRVLKYIGNAEIDPIHFAGDNAFRLTNSQTRNVSYVVIGSNITIIS